MRVFISQSVMNIVGVTGTKETAARDTGHLEDAIDDFVLTSAMLRTRFRR